MDARRHAAAIGMALLLFLAGEAWSAEAPEVTLKRSDQDVALDATASKARPAIDFAACAITCEGQAPAAATRCGQDLSVAVGRAIAVSTTDTTTVAYDVEPSSVIAYNFRETGKPDAAGCAPATLSICAPLAAGKSELRLAPRDLKCFDGDLHDKGLLIVLTFPGDGKDPRKTSQLILRVPNLKRPISGTEFGFELNLRDRESDGQKFATEGNAAGYVSLSTLKSKHWRGVGHVAFLDDDPNRDIEVGLGAGVAFRAGGWGPGDAAGFSFSAGVAWNLMLNEDSRYTFIGLGINLQREASPPVAR